MDDGKRTCRNNLCYHHSRKCYRGCGSDVLSSYKKMKGFDAKGRCKMSEKKLLEQLKKLKDQDGYGVEKGVGCWAGITAESLTYPEKLLLEAVIMLMNTRANSKMKGGG